MVKFIEIGFNTAFTVAEGFPAYQLDLVVGVGVTNERELGLGHERT